MVPELFHLPPQGSVPNHPQPARLWRAALRGQTPAQIEADLAERGWTNSWRNGIYPFHHYHSTAHEVLVIARGQARLTLGGEGGEQVQVGEGDVLLLPAGTGHRNDGSSPDLLVVGAYAGGGNGICAARRRQMWRRRGSGLRGCRGGRRNRCEQH